MTPWLHGTGSAVADWLLTVWLTGCSLSSVLWFVSLCRTSARAKVGLPKDVFLDAWMSTAVILWLWPLLPVLGVALAVLWLPYRAVVAVFAEHYREQQCARGRESA